MSNVASLELCKELFELSGWDGFEADAKRSDMPHWGISKVPQYDAGYLLRKLQAIDDPDNGNPKNIYVELTVVDGYSAATSVRGLTRVDADQPHQRRLPSCDADTPEDALCKLAIELFKAGILPISGRD